MKRFALATTFFATALLVMPAKMEAKGYGMAGCGLGSVVIGPKPGIVQVFAATTNMSFYSQTFGIIMGTLNCTADGVIKAEMEQRAFVAYNFDSLYHDVAMGTGESVDSLAFLMGCSEASMPEFANTIQGAHEEIFHGEKGTEPDWVLHRIKETVAGSDQLNQSCSRIWL